jgi:hypothetical protein
VVDEHEQPLVVEFVRDVPQEEQRALVGPLGVVEDDDDRPRERTQQPGHGVEQPEPLLARVPERRRHGRGGEQLGRQPGEVRDDPELGGHGVHGCGAAEPPQDLAPRPVRRRSGVLRPGAPRHRRAVRAAHELFGQPGLADPGLAAAQHQPRAACAGVGERGRQYGELATPAHEVGPHRPLLSVRGGPRVRGGCPKSPGLAAGRRPLWAG